MAALTPTAAPAPGRTPRQAPDGKAVRVRARRRPRVWRGAVLALAGL
ncbi:hypothetical protein ACFV9P_32365 [Streptomyces sp. NPDC059892]